MITSLQFDDPQIVIVGETMSFTGRLIVTDTGEGISGRVLVPENSAKISREQLG